MIKTLLLFILSCFRISFFILRIAIVKALLPRMPLPNWVKEREANVSVGQVDNDDVQVGKVMKDSRTIKLWKRGKCSVVSVYIGST